MVETSKGGRNGGVYFQRKGAGQEGVLCGLHGEIVLLFEVYLPAL